MLEMFWSVILVPGKRYSRTLDRVYHINGAALSVNNSDGDELVSVWFQCSSDPPILLCNLNRQRSSCQLNLYFNIGESVSFWANSGKSNVYLTGLTYGTMGDMKNVSLSCNSYKWWCGKFTSIDMKSHIYHDCGKKRRKDRNWTFPAKQQKAFSGSSMVESNYVNRVSKMHLRSMERAREHKKIDGSVSLPMAPGHWFVSKRLIEEKEYSNRLLTNNVQTLACMLNGKLKVPEALFCKETTTMTAGKSEESLEMLTNPLNGQLSIMNGLKNNPVENSRETSHLLTCLLKGQLHISPTTFSVEETLSTQTCNESPSQSTSRKKTLEGGVEIEDLVIGDGVEVKAGCQVTVFYSGRLKQDKKLFDSVKTGLGLRFRVGHGEVFKGWEIGVVGMRVGGRRIISIPPQMAYGTKGHPPLIPPNSVLIFDVQLKNVRQGLDEP